MLSEQEEALITYMESHSGFSQNKFMGINGVQQRQEMWLQLVLILNALGPAKDVKSWQEVCTVRYKLFSYFPNININYKLFSFN